MGVLTFAGFCLPACHSELDVRQAYPFALTTLPVQKDIVKGDVAEIRCTLKAEGEFKDSKYTIRYFQADGKGTLQLDDGRVLTSNDRFPLERKDFRLYYTALSSDHQTIDVYIEDNFGQMKELHFSFNGKNAEKSMDNPKSGPPSSKEERNA